MDISPIIEIEELIKIHKNSNVLIFDVSTGENAKINYEREHLEGALHIDLNSQLAEIKEDFSQGGRHPLPEIKQFAKTLSILGITINSHIVIYDDKNGSNAAARCWWMLKSAGHSKVQVLNGGMDHAKKNKFPLSSTIEVAKSVTEIYPIKKWLLPTVELIEVEKMAQDSSCLIVDVRSKERFDGIFEPIDLIAGHIPNAMNIPFTENLDENGLFLKPHELKNIYKKKFGDKESDKIVVHCGSGVTACHTLLALAYASIELPNLYVGSWSEWSRTKKIERTSNSL